jgi:hypothetical protein
MADDPKRQEPMEEDVRGKGPAQEEEEFEDVDAGDEDADDLESDMDEDAVDEE